jgi:isocitrate/isopropylmalate dehydrogenase
VEKAVISALQNGVRTPDAGGHATTQEFTQAVLSGLAQR